MIHIDDFMENVHKQTLMRDAAPDLYAALKDVTIAFGDDEYASNWAEREDNEYGSKAGYFLTAKQVKAMHAALAKAEGKQL